MGQWVLLKHDLPDGSWHHDWMLERDDTGAGGSTSSLLSFRLHPELTWPPSGGGWFRADQIADHRREYLTYEGPVSGGRGRVSRVCRGVCEARRDGEDWVIGMDGRWFRGMRVAEGGAGVGRDGAVTWQFVPITPPTPPDLED